ncbi:MAG: glycosyltransferase N-terminal domain-containing protein [Gemmatimonadales bacterium]
MSFTDILYSLGWQTVRPLLWVAGRFSDKLARAVAGRKAASEALQTWAAAHRAATSPLVWLHGASAGELAGAAPIVARLRDRRPEMQLVVTYSSPSGEAAARRLRPDHQGFVPLDLLGHTAPAIAALRPSALVYAKHDVWPHLTAAARAHSVPVALVNATVRPGSGRLRRPGRAVLRRAYAALDAVGAVAEADRDRLVALGVRPGVIEVTGDASFDQALARLEDAGAQARRLPPQVSGVLRLIAGSTWPEDEEFLVEAAANLEALELVLVPHEPTPEAVTRIRNLVSERLGRPIRLYSRLDETEAPRGRPGEAPPPLVVDAVGFLAQLYPEGDAAYVGGGLAGTGLHSVVEPAAAGRPVLFGSRHDRWEAVALVDAEAACEVDPTNVYAVLVSLMDARRRRRMGDAARNCVMARAGADERGAALVRRLVDVDWGRRRG